MQNLQAAYELGGDHLGGAGEEGLGEGCEDLSGYESGFGGWFENGFSE